MDADGKSILDRDQLREITFNDESLMREILSSLIDDTARQIQLIDAAIREQDSARCMRLAHYSKGACANLGAVAAASILKDIENRASHQDFQQCRTGLERLSHEIELLRAAAVSP